MIKRRLNTLKAGTSIGTLVLMYAQQVARQVGEDPNALNLAASKAVHRMLRSWTPSK
jgi:hypothetical protein